MLDQCHQAATMNELKPARCARINPAFVSIVVIVFTERCFSLMRNRFFLAFLFSLCHSHTYALVFVVTEQQSLLRAALWSCVRYATLFSDNKQRECYFCLSRISLSVACTLFSIHASLQHIYSPYFYLLKIVKNNGHNK